MQPTSECTSTRGGRDRGLGAAAPSRARRALRGRAHRLVPRLRGPRLGAGEKGGELTGRNPTDRGKAGTKYHLLVDARGLILHTLLSPANTHDSVQFEPLLETNPGVRAHRHRPGRPRRRPDKLHADKGYDYPRCRVTCTSVGSKSASLAAASSPATISAGSAGRRTQHLLAAPFQRLGLRYDRTQRTLRPLLTLGCVLINLRRLVQKEF